jgi:hypothetical protein
MNTFLHILKHNVLDILHCDTNISYNSNILNLLTSLKQSERSTHAAHKTPHWLFHLNLKKFNENLLS